VNADQYRHNLESFKDQVMTDHRVIDGTLTSIAPGTPVGWYSRTRRVGGDIDGQPIVLYQTTIDKGYFKTYNIELAQGRFFSEGTVEDSTNVILNEKAVEQLGFASAEEAIQGKVTFRGDTFNVIGVIKNYHQESPKEDFRPAVYRMSSEERSYFSFRFSGGDPSTLLERMQTEFGKVFPGMPFEYFFVRDRYNAQYDGERKFLGTFTLFAAIAIVVASLGLFGLSSYTIVQRTKEVGIRKALGSSDQALLVMFSSEFFKLIVLGNLIAVPVVWFAMDKWLSGFAERVAIGGTVFLGTAVITTLLAMATISYHAIRTARLNPAKALKYE
jgi:putative ABC transport system permease protein